jgi:pyruvate-ferredoxin/flavodoxin oxidoreductase
MLAREGKNPLTLDSKPPDGSIQEFLSGENRYRQLERSYPEESRRFRSELERDVWQRYEILRRLAEEEPILGPGEPSGGTGSESGGETEHCEVKDVAEHARPDSGEACDDDRGATD